MDERAKAIQLIKMKGPVIPSNISKELEKDLLFTSVILAELVSSKQLKISHLKIGSSPLYYLSGQEYRLDNFYKYLNEKDRGTFDILKKNKVLRDSEQDPLTRISLQKIKDFAVPLDVTLKNGKETFWKWHTLSNQEAVQLIKVMIAPKQEEEKKEEIEKKEHIETQRTFEEPVSSETKMEYPNPETLKEKSSKEEPSKEKRDKVVTTKEVVDNSCNDPFFMQIKSFFMNNEIEIVSYEIIKKNMEIDFEVRIKSSVGKLPYFCRAKNKKRISDSDIASAFVQAQLKKLPLLFVTLGDTTKKAARMLEKEFSSVKLVKI